MYELECKQNQKLRELIDSVIEEYGSEHDGRVHEFIGCCMCFNSLQLQKLLEESKK